MIPFRRQRSANVEPTFQVVLQGRQTPFGRRGLRLREPILIAAFEGWNDAGEAASSANRYLERAWSATAFGEIDGEEFFDYTTVRPETSYGPDGKRRISWPATKLYLSTSPEFAHDVVLLRAPEPQLRWRAYCDVLVDVAQRIGVRRVLTLGALLSEVTHRRPVPVNVTSAGVRQPESTAPPSSPYEGPTGIVGVLSSAFTAAGMSCTSAWASVPCYSFSVSQKAALALVEMTSRLLDRPVDTTALEEEAREYVEKMNDLVADDENIAAYVARIEEMEDAAGHEVSTEALTDEIERYLRGRRSG